MTAVDQDVAARVGSVPSGTARARALTSEFRAQKVEKDGKQFVQLDGVASSTEQPYSMWDMFGEYQEVMDAGAFKKTLAAKPDVAFLVNHGGMTMARTTNGTLTLSADDRGLVSSALLNPKRQDVSDLITAIEDGIVDEMSFAFTITRGQWSPDFTEYRILEVDLDRGDVSAVNYGANPNTSIAARTQQMFAAIEVVPDSALRAAIARAADKLGADVTIETGHRSQEAKDASEQPSMALQMLRNRFEAGLV